VLTVVNELSKLSDRILDCYLNISNYEEVNVTVTKRPFDANGVYFSVHFPFNGVSKTAGLLGMAFREPRRSRVTAVRYFFECVTEMDFLFRDCNQT
jgi:hypothetical protein